jgi:hypothetical protein
MHLLNFQFQNNEKKIYACEDFIFNIYALFKIIIIQRRFNQN